MPLYLTLHEVVGQEREYQVIRHAGELVTGKLFLTGDVVDGQPVHGVSMASLRTGEGLVVNPGGSEELLADDVWAAERILGAVASQ